jgi:ParB family chromosome partitioning protein
LRGSIADEVTQWETFTRLVKQGRDAFEIAATFGLPDLAVRRILALGNLLPRIRDRSTRRERSTAPPSATSRWRVRASSAAGWRCSTTHRPIAPSGHQLKAWLFGGQSIKARFALFDLDTRAGATVADLFGEERYFADADAFWAAQNAAIEARRAAYLDEGWSDVVVVPATSISMHGSLRSGQAQGRARLYRRARDRRSDLPRGLSVGKGGAPRRARRGPEVAKTARPEMTATMQTYLDLHRHAAVRAALLTAPGVALRLMVAHAIAGSHLWRVSPEPQSTQNDAVRESVETCRGETMFDERAARCWRCSASRRRNRRSSAGLAAAMVWRTYSRA